MNANSVSARTLVLAFTTLLVLPFMHGQEPQPVITLAKSPQAERAVGPVRTFTDVTEEKIAAARESYRELAVAKVGQSSTAELFSLEFHGTTKLTGFSATADFHVASGTCIEGHIYVAGDRCNLEVRFTPQGPGHRTGRLSVVHSASATPFLTPIGGTAYAPAVSFIPSQIQTVPGTYAGSGATAAGTLLSPGELALDGGDNLYIADTGHNLIKFRDSSGVISTFAGGGATSAIGYAGFGPNVKFNSPYGVAVDYSGTVYIADTGDNVVLVRYLDGILNNRLGDGSTTSCPYSSPCSPSATKISAPYSITTDFSGNIYVATKVGGSLPGFYIGENDVSSLTQTYYTLGTTAYNYYSTSSAIAVDPYGDLLYTYEDPGGPLLSPTPLCYLLGQNRAYSTGQAGQRFWTVAGNGLCGFSGDGGKATGAEISTNIGQFAFDAAGNFYFADTGNNRVRRVDAVTGIIHTVGGSGGAGFGGDGGSSTGAPIQAPTGIAVDSSGRVYATGVAGNAGAPGAAEIRSFGTTGYLNFGNVTLASHSAAQTVLLSNVGNDTLNFTHAAISSGNTGDFAIDPNTTTCNFTGSLLSGHTCNVGFIFTPAATGARSAVLTIADDTVSGTQTVQLAGTGVGSVTLTPATIAFPATTLNTSSSPVVATLTNTGASAITITAAPSFTGTNATSFLESTTCGSTLAAGASCNISVVFKPLSAGALTATLVVKDSAGTGQQTIALNGTGGAATGTVSFSPVSLTFPSTKVGSTCAPQVLTFNNSTGSALSVSSFVFGGVNGSSFLIATKSCGTSLAAGSSCTISIAFKPTTTGSLAGTISANDNAANTPQVAMLDGPAVAAAVKSKVTLASTFNPVAQGQSPQLRSLVTDAAGVATPATGSVQLKEGSRVLAESTLSNGIASFSLNTLTAGAHVLNAVYLGDARHQAATSGALRQMVSVKLIAPGGYHGPRRARLPFSGSVE